MHGYLELEPERTLQIACVADNRGNLADLRIADGCDRITKLRMIEHVERFHPELQNHLLMDGEGLEERRIKVCPPWTNQTVAARVAVGVWRRSSVRRRQEPVIEGLGINNLRIRNEIGPARRTRVGCGGLQNRREPKTALREQYSVGLPTAQNKVRHPTAIEILLALAERQSPQITE